MDPSSRLALDWSELRDVREALGAAIDEGLARPGQMIKALPAWQRRPSQRPSGDACVVDFGGTNLRVAVIESSKDLRFVMPPVESAEMLRDAKTRGIDADDLARVLASAVAQGAPRGADLRVGYCFSFPAEVQPDGDARLIHWTKGVNIGRMEGTLVGRHLRDALAAAGATVRRVSVVNDTVATLLAAALLQPSFSHHIGLIVGTGTNMAAFYPVRRIAKIGRPQGWSDDDLMAVNLESGNFDPPHLRDADARLDQRSDNPGRQRFEKAVSGDYLPRVAFEALGEARAAGAGLGEAWTAPDAARLVDLRRREAPGADVADDVLCRSADLVAAGLAGLIRSMGCTPGDRVGILAEGSLFWKTPGYRDRVESTLARLSHAPFSLLHAPEEMGANFLGAACAALTP